MLSLKIGNDRVMISEDWNHFITVLDVVIANSLVGKVEGTYLKNDSVFTGAFLLILQETSYKMDFMTWGRWEWLNNFYNFVKVIL